MVPTGILSAEQVAQYQELGYCIYPQLLGQQEVKAYLADIEEICASATLAHHDSSRLEMELQQLPDGRMVRRIYEPCTYYSLSFARTPSAETLRVSTLTAAREPGPLRAIQVDEWPNRGISSLGCVLERLVGVVGQGHA